MSNLDRDREIVAAYRDAGVLSEVGRKFGLTRQRIHQIVKKHEIASGEKLPRDGQAIAASERLNAATVIWRCSGCGEERQYLKSRAKHKRCAPCYSRRKQ